MRPEVDRFQLLVAAVLGLAGLGILATAVEELRVGTPEEELARASALPATDPAGFSRATPGTEVLVEGVIAPGAPAVFEGFVAARRERNRARRTDKTDWVSVRTYAPPLALVGPGGAKVQLTQDYELGAVCHPWQDSPDYERSSGFRVGDQVVAVGVVSPAGLTARVMSCGDRAAWLRRVKEQAEAARVLGPVFTLLGLVLLVGTGVLVRRSVGARRR